MNPLLSQLTGDTLFTGPLMLGLAVVLLGCLAIAFRPRWKDRLEARLKGLHTTSYNDLAVSATDLQADTEEEQATFSQRVLHRVAEAIAPLPLIGKKEQAKVEQHLARAGLRSHLGVPLFMLAKASSGALVALAVVGYFLIQPHPDMAFVLKAIIAAGGFVFGGLLPEFILKKIGFARRQRIAIALPDAMDLLVICAEAGLSLEVAMDRVRNEMKLSAPDLSIELSVTVAELQLLSDRHRALANLAYRTDLEALRGVVTTLVQAQRFGTPLSQSLRVLGKEMRTARMLAVEEKAARLPALISMPLVGFILPAIFVIVGGPAFLQIAQILGN